MKNRLYLKDVLLDIKKNQLLNKPNFKSYIYIDNDEHLHVCIVKKIKSYERYKITEFFKSLIGGVDNGK